jgi:hypothetical protein
MLAMLALGLTLPLSQQPQTATDATAKVFALLASAGFVVKTNSYQMHDISFDDVDMSVSFIQFNGQAAERTYGSLLLSRYYRPKSHVSLAAISDQARSRFQPTYLNFYERVNGDIEVTAAIPIRWDMSSEECKTTLRRCFYELGDAQEGGLRVSEGTAHPIFADSHLPVDMSKVVDYLSERDLEALTDDAWGWRDNRAGGHTGPWSHMIDVDNTLIALGHPGSTDIGVVNGIALLGRIPSTDPKSGDVLVRLQQEVGNDIKLFRAEGTDRFHFGVLALVDYGNGITLQDLHDRIEKFAKIIASHQK